MPWYILKHLNSLQKGIVTENVQNVNVTIYSKYNAIFNLGQIFIPQMQCKSYSGWNAVQGLKLLY